MIRRLLTLAIAFTVALATVGPLQPAGAADNGEWGLLPVTQEGQPPRPNFVLDATPGTTVTDVLVLINHKDEPLELNLYPADAHNTASGGFALKDQDEPRVGVGAWVSLPVEDEKITLEPESQVAIPIVIEVPADAAPGDHAGGIVGIQPEATATTEESGVNIGLRYGVGVRIYLRVSGPAAPQVAVTDVDVDVDQTVGGLFGLKSRGVVSYTIKNTGNLLIPAEADVVVHGLGWEDKLPTATVPDLLPGETAEVRQAFSGALPTGRVTADVEVRAFDETATGSATTLAIPWLLLAVLLLTFVTWRIRRRRRARRGGPGPATAAGSDPAPGSTPARVRETVGG